MRLCKHGHICCALHPSSSQHWSDLVPLASPRSIKAHKSQYFSLSLFIPLKQSHIPSTALCQNSPYWTSAQKGSSPVEIQPIRSQGSKLLCIRTVARITDASQEKSCPEFPIPPFHFIPSPNPSLPQLPRHQPDSLPSTFC